MTLSGMASLPLEDRSAAAQKASDQITKNKSGWPASIQKENYPDTYRSATDEWAFRMWGRKFNTQVPKVKK
jgi:hypothetical protein